MNDFRDATLQANELTGPRLPVSFISKLIQDIAYSRQTGATGVVGTFLGEMRVEGEPPDEAVAQTNFLDHLQGGDLGIPSLDDSVREEFITINSEVGLEISAKCTKYGRVRGVAAQTMSISVTQDNIVKVFNFTIAVENPDQYSTDLGDPETKDFESTVSDFMFQYLHQCLLEILGEEAVDGLNLMERETPWDCLTLKRIGSGVWLNVFEPKINQDTFRLRPRDTYPECIILPISQFDYMGAQALIHTGELYSEGAVPLKTSNYTYERFHDIPITRENMAFVLDPELITSFGESSEEFIMDPWTFLETRLKEFASEIGFPGGIDSFIENFLGSMERIEGTPIVSIPFPVVPGGMGTPELGNALLSLLALHPDKIISKIFAGAGAFNQQIRMERGVLRESDWLEMNDAINSIGGYLAVRDGPYDVKRYLGDQPYPIRSLEWGGRYIMYYFASEFLAPRSIFALDLLQLECVINGIDDWNRLKSISIDYHEVPVEGGFENARFTGALLVLTDPNSDNVEMVSFNNKPMGEVMSAIFALYPNARVFIPDLNWSSYITGVRANGAQVSLHGDTTPGADPVVASSLIPMPVYNPIPD